MRTKFLTLLRDAFNRFTKPLKDWRGKKSKKTSHIVTAPYKLKQERRKIGPSGSNNHSVSEPKYLHRMRVRSNNINRQRIKKWKY